MTWLRDVFDRLLRRPVMPNEHSPEIQEAHEALEYMRGRRRQITEERIRSQGQAAERRVSGR